MTIVYFSESLPPLVDGVTLTLGHLFETLEKRGIEFRIYSPFDPGERVGWSSRVQTMPSMVFPLYRDYRLSLPPGPTIARQIDALAPQLIHVVSPTPVAIWAQRYAARRGVPIVTSFHTDFVSYFRYYGFGRFEEQGWAYLRWFYNRCARVYVPSSTTGRELQERGIQGIELWSRGIDLTRFSPHRRCTALRAALGADENTPLVLLVSRLVKEKDLDDLVAMHRLLVERGVAHRLALVGDGPMRPQLEAELPDAHFAGWLAGDELAKWYASADAFVFPSTTETFGNVVLEAMASGLPAIVVDRGGPPGLVDAGETGFITRPNVPAELADAAQTLLEDPARRSAMGLHARSAALRYSWDEVNGRLLDSYSLVMQEHERVTQRAA